MSKLEKVAIRYRKKTGRPIIMVFNNVGQSHRFHRITNALNKLMPLSLRFIS